MDIIDPRGGAPALALGPFSRANYAIANAPATPGTLRWSLSGDTSSLRIDGPDDQAGVALASMHRSETAGATTLTATFAPTDGRPTTTAAIALTVFGAEIRDPASDSATARTTLGVGDRASWRPVTVPAIAPFVATWTPSSGGPVAIADVASTGEVEILGLRASRPGDGAAVTLSIAVGDQQASLGVPVQVFGVEIELCATRGDERAPSGPVLGVGETILATARSVPADFLRTAPCTFAWQVPDHLQAVGPVDARSLCVVANAPGEGDVELALRCAGSATVARRALRAYGVDITAEDGGPAPEALPVGASARFQVVVTPPVDEAQVFWRGGPTVALAADGASVAVQGVQASAHDGVDALSATVLVGTALAHAVVPLTVYATRICAPGGVPPVTTLSATSPQRFAVATQPALGAADVSWSVTGGAALSGDTRAMEIDVFAVGGGSTGDPSLQVSVVPPGLPHGAPTAVLALSAPTTTRR